MVRTRPRYDAQAGDTPAFNAMVTSAQTRYSRGELTSRKKGVPQFIYTGLVVGMSALTIGLGISAATAHYATPLIGRRRPWRQSLSKPPAPPPGASLVRRRRHRRAPFSGAAGPSARGGR